jgi:hypothetical protein
MERPGRMLRFLRRLLGKACRADSAVFRIHGGNHTYLLFMGARRDRLMGRYRTEDSRPKEGDFVELKDSQSETYFQVVKVDVMTGPGYQGLRGFVEFHVSVGDPL